MVKIVAKSKHRGQNIKSSQKRVGGGRNEGTISKDNPEKSPKQSGSKYYNCAINRRQATRLVQLRTGHIPLNQYLHRFHIIDSPNCACGQGVETISHYILHCKQYIKQRSELRSKVEPRGMKLHTLLGDPKHAKAITEYVAETKRFV